jgi:hypothetical protein
MKALTIAFGAALALAATSPVWADTEVERETEETITTDDGIRQREKTVETESETEERLGAASRSETRRETTTRDGDEVTRERHVEEEVEVDD